MSQATDNDVFASPTVSGKQIQPGLPQNSVTSPSAIRQGADSNTWKIFALILFPLLIVSILAIVFLFPFMLNQVSAGNGESQVNEISNQLPLVENEILASMIEIESFPQVDRSDFGIFLYSDEFDYLRPIFPEGFISPEVASLQILTAGNGVVVAENQELELSISFWRAIQSSEILLIQDGWLPASDSPIGDWYVRAIGIEMEAVLHAVNTPNEAAVQEALNSNSQASVLWLSDPDGGNQAQLWGSYFIGQRVNSRIAVLVPTQEGLGVYIVEILGVR